jgi:hypothetical protein
MSRHPSQGRIIRCMLAALVLAALSYLSFPAFVHTYCENRPIMLILAAMGVGTIYLLIRFWPLTPVRKVGAMLAILLCLLEITFNVWFFVWANRVCAAQKRMHY